MNNTRQSHPGKAAQVKVPWFFWPAKFGSQNVCCQTARDALVGPSVGPKENFEAVGRSNDPAFEMLFAAHLQQAVSELSTSTTIGENLLET